MTSETAHSAESIIRLAENGQISDSNLLKNTTVGELRAALDAARHQALSEIAAILEGFEAEAQREDRPQVGFLEAIRAAIGVLDEGVRKR